MLQVKHTFQEHKDEINLFYDFLEELIKHDARLIIDPPVNSIRNIKVETTAIAKSSFFLMLYNCVESTVTNLLRILLKAMEDDGCKYGDLREEIQLSAIAAYEYCTRESENKQKRNEALKRQIDFSSGLSIIHIDIKSLVGSSSQGNFSGSLDAREIRSIFSMFGIDLTALCCGEMFNIKVCRNKLAHGECSFQDFGRDLTIQYIRVSKDTTLNYLNTLINIVEEFISNKQYRRVVPTKKKGLLSRLYSFLGGN